MSKREALRVLLSDGKWHHMSECRKVGGWRFGARLLELRQGLGGPAVPTEHRAISGSDNEFEYRALVGPQAELPLATPKKSNRFAELVAENARLKRRVADLEAGVGV